MKEKISVIGVLEGGRYKFAAADLLRGYAKQYPEISEVFNIAAEHIESRKKFPDIKMSLEQGGSFAIHQCRTNLGTL